MEKFAAQKWPLIDLNKYKPTAFTSQPLVEYNQLASSTAGRDLQTVHKSARQQQQHWQTQKLQQWYLSGFAGAAVTSTTAGRDLQTVRNSAM
jgi:hypothetical protein